MILTGKVIMAETGKADSTLTAMLYRNIVDSAVRKFRPDYMAKCNGQGRFTFTNLAPGTYKLYALKDGDGSKTYNSKTETFAFADSAVIISPVVIPVTVYAYAEENDTRGQIVAPLAKASASIKKLFYTSSTTAQNQDLLDDLELSFNKLLKKFDSTGIKLTDTSYNIISTATVKLDSSRKKIFISNKWREDMSYRLIINSAAMADSLGNHIAKTDTLRFKTKKESEYGNVVLRFSNLDLSRHP